MNKIKDSKNVDYVFQNTDVDILMKIVNNDIDIKKKAQEELKKRGLNNEGIWVGFK